MTDRVVVNESQVLGSKITRIENWFREHPGVYDAVKRDELRTLYATLGDETKAFEQSDIVLANQLNDQKTLLLLSESATNNNGTISIKHLLGVASRFPQFAYVGAAVRIRAADLLASNGQTKAALATYQLVFNGPGNYAQLAKEKSKNLDRLKTSILRPGDSPIQAQR